jgi:acetyl esterase
MDSRRTPLTLEQEFTLAWSRMYSSAVMGAVSWHQDGENAAVNTYTFGTHPDECLDILPAGPGRTGLPVFFIHGGGWTMGRKEFYQNDLESLCAAGHQVFNVEYPKAPAHPHPYILQSIFSALAWVKQNQNVEYLHIVGDSAGGNLAVMAALLAANPKLRLPLGKSYAQFDVPKIVSVTSLYGVLDRHTCIESGMAGGAAMIAAYGGQEALEQTVDADHAITPMDVTFDVHHPCFLAVGSEDALGLSSEIYRDRLKKMNRPVTFKTYEGAAHGFLNWPRDKQRLELLEDIRIFLAETEALN